MRHAFLTILAAAFVAALATRTPAADRPNIVVILADDYGYGSAGCYGGSSLKTPNLDRLAREGRRFTQAYCPGSVCSPTRYGLMTGRYYWRTRIKDGEVLPGNAPLHIETDRLTLASLCKRQGYRTAAFGKWHLGFQAGVTQADWNLPLEPGPLAVGFDHFFGLAANPWNGPHSFIDDRAITGRIPGQPIVVTGGREQAKTSGIVKPYQENEIMKVLTENAVAWLEQPRQEPFFLYFAANAVHLPVAPSPAFTGSKLGSYGDFIEELDGSVGRILDTIEKLGHAGDTLVLFSSDNGGVVNPNVPSSAFAMNAGLAINGALRGGKHDVWEGGFRVPLLVRWPGKVPAGTVSPQVVCLTDVLATLAGILGVPLRAGQAEDSFDIGRALVEATPGAPVRDHVILQDSHATYAIRSGDWKLVERQDPPAFAARNQNAQKKIDAVRRKEAKHDELFDLAADPAEANERHAAHPDVVARLRRTLAAVRDRGASRPLVALAAPVARGEDGRPNVVFVLVDDMGYADVGCYGAKDIRTPNVDRLAREGVRMTDFYANGPVCSPTRCGFITGRWQQRAGLEWALGVTSQCLVREGQGQSWRPEPDYKRFGLRAGEPTIARLLSDAGYRAACIGKWHLGWRPENSPAAHGFGTAFGIYGGNADLYSHKGRDGTADLYENGRPVREEGYLTELLSRRAVSFIEQNRQRPFFLYVPYNAVHWPFQPPGRPDLVRSYDTWYEGDRRTYAQMVEAIDAGVGEIRSALERAGVLDRTLFVFSNDNGGEVRLTSNRPLFHHKATVWEGGIRVPCILRWPGHLPAGVESRQVGVTMDLTATFLAACGVSPPSDHPLDGIDLVPILAGHKPEAVRTLGWRIDRIERKQKALRHGKWKLVVDGPHDVVKHELLFDLDADVSERNNVAYEHPEVLAELRKRLEAWEADVDARPLPFVVK